MFSMTNLAAPKVGQQVPLEVAGSRDFSFRAPIALLACVLDLFDGRQHRSPYWGCVKDDEGSAPEVGQEFAGILLAPGHSGSCIKGSAG